MSSSPSTTSAPPPSSKDHHDPIATPEMCYYSFDLLHHLLSDNSNNTHSILSTSTSSSSSRPKPGSSIPNYSEIALFVTLKKRKVPPLLSTAFFKSHSPFSNNTSPTTSANSTSATTTPHTYSLRGCIGTLTPLCSLHTALSEYTTAAAFRDRRFPQLKGEELSKLKISVSILKEFRVLPRGRVHDWEIGVHGLIIEWNDEDEDDGDDGGVKKWRRGTRGDDGGFEYTATYLPEVCVEQGWSKEECLKSLIGKAGWMGEVDERLLGRIRLTVYRSSRCAVEYEEWKSRSGKVGDLGREMNGLPN